MEHGYLQGYICLDRITKEMVQTGRDGKKYISIAVSERRMPSQYGDTHYVKAYVPQEKRGEGLNPYIGSLKHMAPRDEALPPVRETKKEEEKPDWLPF